jgi:hypothetical protein
VGSERARQLAGSIDAANLELIQLVRGLSEEQWQTVANDEGDGRPVGVIAHHVAHGHGDSLDWVETALSGAEVTITLDQQDALNAEHAATYHDVTREETAELLESLGRELRDRVAELTDPQLDGTAFHRGAGREMTVEAYARLGQRHVSGHLATIRKALDLD